MNAPKEPKNDGQPNKVPKFDAPTLQAVADLKAALNEVREAARKVDRARTQTEQGTTARVLRNAGAKLARARFDLDAMLQEDT